MSFIVTGGAGFIGSNIVETLVKNDEKVTVVDNLHTGSLDNMKGVKDKIDVVVGGMEKLTDMKPGSVDGIFHFGIPSSSPMYKDNHTLTGDAINDMIRVLDFARKNDSKIVFASSSSVYSGLEPPHREDMDILVSDYYTEARLCMERLAELYYQLHGVNTIALRLFSVYGPHEENKGVFANLISQFMWSMKRDEQPVIYGDGSQKRDFTYVRGIVEAAMLAMKSDIKNDIFNVGTGKCYDLNDVVDILNKLLGTSIKPKYIENPIKNYVQTTHADTTKAENVLKFRFRKSIDECIREYMDL